jgi:FSR family fosmidomycin resistance protein-like MFS transporter
MIALAAVSGIADSVFHPADYTILTHKVRPAWLGRAYSVHTFTGFLGFAVAPLVMSFLLSIGTWRFALAAVGIAGLVTAAFLFAVRRLLDGVTYQVQRAPGTKPQGTLALMLSPPLIMMFLFYCTTTLGSNGIQTFANSAVMALFDVDIVRGNAALASFLWGTAAGVLVGGVIADRINRFDAVSAIAYVIGAALLCLIGLVLLPYALTLGALFFVGFMGGVVMPSRDLMVRLVTPPGSIGKAFGYVSSGFGVGGVFGPLIYGTLMDWNLPQIVFFVSAGMMIATIGVALLASWSAKRAGGPGMAPAPAKAT